MFTTFVILASLAAQPAEPKPVLPAFAADAVKPSDKDTPLRKLQKERVRERAEAIERMKKVIDIGRWDANLLEEYVTLRNTLAANLAELVEKPEEKAKCHEMRVEALKEMETLVESMVKAGSQPAQMLNLAKAARIDAEIDLLKCKETFALDLPNDPDALTKTLIANMNAMVVAIEKKEPAEKVRAAGMLVKATMAKLEALKLSKESQAALSEKYKKELTDIGSRLIKASLDNPDAAKIISDVLQK